MSNILYISRAMGLGGTENVILQLCELLKDKHHIIVCSSGGVNVKKLDELNIRHYTIPNITSKSPLTILKVLYGLNSIITQENIEIIHTHHRMAAFYARLIICTKRVFFVHTMHNVFHDKKLLTNFILRNAFVVAVGMQVKNNLVNFYGIPSTNITVICNSVRPFQDNITPIKVLQNNKKEGNFLIGNIGRYTEQKGMSYFIKAIPNIIKKCPNTKFVLVGDGVDKDKLSKLITKLGIEANVIELGYRSDVQNVMCQLDLIVLSSLWEGFPLTPIEAFSVGRTVVATAVDGTVEIVNNQQNGVLVNSKSSNELSNAIIELIVDGQKRKRLEQQALLAYKEKFSYEKLEESYKEFYNTILKK